MKTGSRAADPTLQVVPLAGWDWEAPGVFVCDSSERRDRGRMGPLVFPGGPGFSLWLHWDRMSETPDALTFARVLPAMQTKHGLS